MGIQDEPLTATPLQNSLLELYGLVSIAVIGEYWVGPNQAIKMTMEDWKKGACFWLRITILGRKRAFWRKGMMRCQERTRKLYSLNELFIQ